MGSQAHPPTVYSQEQVEHFLKRIDLPGTQNNAKNLEYLTKLQVHTLTHIPFENLALHYSREHITSIDPQVLYQKCIVRRRGGYCMENNVLLQNMLAAIGFDVYAVGARVNKREHGIPVGPFMGWSHQVLIVTLVDGQQYAVDVGFGGDGPTHPLPLEHKYSAHNIGTQDLRLVHESRGNANSPKVWVYQIRPNSETQWQDCYLFPETEFWPQDFNMMRHYVDTQTWFTELVVAGLFIDSTGDGKIDSKNTLAAATAKRYMNGKSEVVKECRTEEERIEVLRKMFGIELDRDEMAQIRGRGTELVAP